MPNTPPIPAKPAPPHTLVALRGRLGTGGQSPETWQVNVRGTGFVGSPATEAQIAEMVTAAQAWIGQGAFTDAVHLDELRISKQGADGHQVGDTLVVPATAVGGGSQGVPFQISLVVSLVSAGRAPGHKGRWYPPPTAYQSTNVDGLVPAATVVSYLGAARTFVNAMNAAGLGVAIVGRTGTTGTIALVTELRCGRVLDTQRRRRRSLGEAYAAVPITA